MAHALGMDTRGNGGSTGVLDRPGTSGELRRRSGRDRLRDQAPRADVIDMQTRARLQVVPPSGEAPSRLQGNPGLGAFTAIVFTVIAYATMFGAWALVGVVRSLASGEDAGGGLLTALVLLAPVVAAVVGRLWRPADRPADAALGERDAARRSA